MKALLFSAIREHKLVDMPLPAIGRPDEVLLKVKSVGVCGSDLHGYTGGSGRRIPPMIMGHEATGEVVAVGEGVADLPIGARAAIQPVLFCGECAQCRAGHSNVCERRRVMGVNAPGAFAEYVVWPRRNLFELPESLSFEYGALTEPLAVAVHAVALARTG